MAPSWLSSSLPALLLASSPAVEAAWIVRSKNNNSWATGFARFDALRRPVVVSTQFHNRTEDLPIEGKMDTDCRIVIADATGLWKEILFEHPQLCVGGTIVDQSGDGIAVLVGIDGNETTLLNVDGVGTSNPTPGTIFSLPEGKIPVATSPGSSSEKSMYVALHDIDGDVSPYGFGADRASNLVGMMSYWDQFTNPLVLAEIQGNHVPHIVKITPATGVMDWKGIYDVTNGSATIAKMVYAHYSLIICGSTNGSGQAYGTHPNPDLNDWDGYVAFINPVTGNVYDAFNNPDSEIVETRGYIRISSNSASTGKHDFAYDMCLIGLSLYVVGTTEGRFSGDTDGGAFVVKIDIRTRAITEQIQLKGADRTGLRIVCSDDHVFVGGHQLYSDTTLDQQQNIYVTAYDSELTESSWSVEVDTTPYFGDSPRLDAIVALEFNPAGDVNLLLNSQIISNGLCDFVFMDLQGTSGANEIQKGASAGPQGGVPEGLLPEPIEGEGESTNSDAQDPDQKKQMVLGLSISIVLACALGLAVFALSDRNKEGNAHIVKPTTPTEESTVEAPQETVISDNADRNVV